jgi:signal transduction histidine kinase
MGSSVLIIDDSQTTRVNLAAAFEAAGFRPLLCATAAEARAALAKERVALVVLDVLLPAGDGIDLLEEIRSMRSCADAPVLLLSPEAEVRDRIRGLRTRADSGIGKPLDPGYVVARARELLGSQSAGAPGEDEQRQVREELLRRELDAAEARAALELAETRAALIDELERKNRELEAFCYSVSHDLRAPLRSIDGFGQALLEDYADALDENGRRHLQRLCAAAHRMNELIDDLLALSRVGRAGLTRERVDLSAVAASVIDELRRREPERVVNVQIAPGLAAHADGRLAKVLLENLLGNAWKFTGRTDSARIELGTEWCDDGATFFVRDNGAGFDMTYAQKLFRPFQRLHSEAEFPGTGIGLATVYRIVDRHGGRVWAEGAVRNGATIFFTMTPRRSANPK